MIADFYKKYNIYLWAGFLSLVLTFVMLSYNEPFDPDGLNYLKTAELLAAHNFKAAFNTYNWMFYPILIVFTSKITTLSFLHAAYLLNAILDAATVLLFIALIKELGGSRKIQIIGALVILFFPYLNFMRQDIMRGHGYYLFAFLSILLLMRFYKNYKWRDSIGWGIAIMLATLCRLEGAVLACFLPLVLLVRPNLKFIHKIKYLLQAYTIQIIMFILILGYVVIFKSANLGRFSEFIGQLSHGTQNTWHPLQHASQVIATQVLGFHLFRYGMAYFLGGALFAVFIGYLLATMGLLYLALSIYSIVKKTIPNAWPAQAVWIYAIVLNIILTIIFLCQRLFLSERYTAFLCLLLLLSVPFALEKIYKTRWFPIVAVLLIYTAVGSIYNFAPSKAYIVEAGKWINKNTPLTAKIYSTSDQCAYFAHRATETQPDKNADYLIFDINRHDKQNEKLLLAKLNLRPIKEFHNRREDKILIFKNK